MEGNLTRREYEDAAGHEEGGAFHLFPSCFDQSDPAPAEGHPFQNSLVTAAEIPGL